MAASGGASLPFGPTVTAPVTEPPPQSGTVELRPSRGNKVILLLAGPPDRSGGVGGWATSERAYRRPARWFQSPPIDAMTLPGILDLYENSQGITIETALGWLYAMGMAGGQDTPPTVKLAGDVRPYDRRLTWVVQGVTLGDRVMAAAGVIAQQNVTVELEGYDPLPTIAKASVQRTRQPGATQPRRRVIRTMKGDTLRSIAVKQLGASNQYTLLRTWNPTFKKTDPDQPLRAGIVMVLH
jgi:hypothetical protein